jgi:hypothetical protein
MFKGGVSGLFQLHLVEFTQAIQNLAAVGPVDAGRTVEIEDGVLVGSETHPVMLAGEEAAAPETGNQWLATLVLGHHHDEGGKVLVHGAQSEIEPRSHAGATGEL